MSDADDKTNSRVDLETGQHFSTGEDANTMTTKDESTNEKSELSDLDGAAAQSSFVDWDGPEDPSNPMNWSKPRKLAGVLTLCALAFVSSCASSIFAPASIPIAEEFHVSNTVANLGVSLYVLGFAAGKSLCT